jgi:hypothetical protein
MISRSFGTKSGSLESLKWRRRCGASPCARQMRCTDETLMPTALAMAAAVQWVASCGGSVAVSATTRSMIAWPSGATREGRVLSRSRPSTPSSAKRSCQRQTQVFDFASAAHDFDRAEAAGRQKHDLRAPDMFLRSVTISYDRLQAAASGGAERDGNPRAHAPDSHAPNPTGIPKWIQPSDFIH